MDHTRKNIAIGFLCLLSAALLWTIVSNEIYRQKRLEDRIKHSVTACDVYSGDQHWPYLRENAIVTMEMSRGKEQGVVRQFDQLPGDRILCE